MYLRHFFRIGLVAAAACTAPSHDPAVCRQDELESDPLLRLVQTARYCDDRSGSGSFGVWTNDARGLPAYRYTLRHETDPRALYEHSGMEDRRLHWSGFGNDRFTAFFYNTGSVELLAPDRGMLSLNRIDPEAGRWGGGIGVVAEPGKKPWSTLAWRNEAVRTRTFTLDGGEVTAEQDGISVVRRTWAPAGDGGALRTETRLHNASDETRTFTYLETWDVLPEQRFLGLAGSGLTKTRERFNQNFAVRGGWDAARRTLTLTFPPKVAQPPGPSGFTYVYPDVYLADLSGKAQGSLAADAVQWDEAARPRVGGAWVEQVEAPSLYQTPLRMTLRWNVTLEPGGSLTLPAAFGYRYPHMPPVEESLTDVTPAWQEHGRSLEENGVVFRLNGEPWLARETAWHAGMLVATSMLDSYHGAHVFNQGSAYGYLQGINGAPRDHVLALLPTIYFRPDLARENLRYIMRITKPSGDIMYAATGYGELTGVGIHEYPSDLDLFLLWGISEYLLATGDDAFLAERVPYHGEAETSSTTVLDHARMALVHLQNVVGTGAHGLIRLRQGDWSDGVILRASDREVAEEHGESGLNAAMAAFVLPRFATAVTTADAALAATARVFATAQAEAFLETWQGEWYLRGYGDVDEPIGVDQFFLEPQIFALLADIVPPDRRAALLRAIERDLEDPSPIGQIIVYPPDEANAFLEPGWDVNGGTWHAMNGLLTAAYARLGSGRAWKSLVANSMRRHAEVYPDLWYGIWSGPDSFNAWYAERPGETFIHLATPMTDFPVLNSNQHALPLFATLQTWGLRAEPAGLTLAPPAGTANYLLRTSAYAVASGPDGTAVALTAAAAGERTLVLRPPHAPGTLTVEAGDAEEVSRDDDTVVVRWRAAAGERLTLTLTPRE